MMIFFCLLLCLPYAEEDCYSGSGGVKKMLADCFKATVVSFLSCNADGMSFSTALFNLRATFRMSSWGVFWGVLILCGNNRTDLTILSVHVLGT